MEQVDQNQARFSNQLYQQEQWVERDESNGPSDNQNDKSFRASFISYEGSCMKHQEPVSYSGNTNPGSSTIPLKHSRDLKIPYGADIAHSKKQSYDELQSRGYPINESKLNKGNSFDRDIRRTNIEIEANNLSGTIPRQAAKTTKNLQSQTEKKKKLATFKSAKSLTINSKAAQNRV